VLGTSGATGMTARRAAPGPTSRRIRGGIMRAASVSDYRELARRRLPNIFFEYIDGGSYAEATLARNVADIEAIALRQRVMRDMTKLDMSIETLGQKLAMPVGLAPVGMAGMYAHRGEVQAARAAAEIGVPFCLSTVGVCSVEEVAKAGVAPWFQLYMLKDRGYMKSLIERAKRSDARSWCSRSTCLCRARATATSAPASRVQAAFPAR